MESTNYITIVPEDKESVKVLKECIELQLKKSKDYQSDGSPVRQADYYLNGIESIYEMLHTKMLRVRSLMHAAKQRNIKPNFESIEDTLKDLINYSSFGVAYIRGGIDGQSPDRDIFNLPNPVQTDVQKYADLMNAAPNFPYPIPPMGAVQMPLGVEAFYNEANTDRPTPRQRFDEPYDPKDGLDLS